MREREDFCPNCTCNHCKEGREREALWRAEEAAARRRFLGGAYGDGSEVPPKPRSAYMDPTPYSKWMPY